MKEMPLHQHPKISEVLSGSEFRVLGQMTLLGLEIGAYDIAGRMAAELSELRPDVPHAVVLLAMSQYKRACVQDALQTAAACIEQFPDFQFGKVLFALFSAHTGSGGWQGMLESVVDEASDEHAVSLACVLLKRDDPFKEAAVRADQDAVAEVHSKPTAGQFWA